MGILGKLKEKLVKKTTDTSSSLPNTHHDNLDNLDSQLEYKILQSKINKQRQDFLAILQNIESAPPANPVHDELGKLQTERAQHSSTELEELQAQRAQRHANDQEFQSKLRKIMEEDSR